MSVSPRVLNGVTAGTTQSSRFPIYWFVRLDIPSVGTKCFTDYPCDPSVNLNIAGDGAFDWFHYGMQVGTVKETNQDIFTVNSLTFDNVGAFGSFVAQQFTVWQASPGLRGVPVHIYRGVFTPATGAYEGGFIRFLGELGGATVQASAGTMTITVKQADSAHVLEMPYLCTNVTCAYLPNYRGVDCAFVGAEPTGEVTCDGTRRACRARTHEDHFGGFDLIGPKDIIWSV